MSVNDQPPSADTTHPQLASSPNFARRRAPDLEALDHRLKRLSDDILPPQPYLLTLPTNAPFRLGSRSANNWAIGHDRPFASDEQQLQYTTFLTHHNTDSLLVAVGDWSDESGRMMVDRSSAPSTTTENPRETVAKRKISLNDYKHHKNSGTTASPALHDSKSRDGTTPTKREEIPQAPKPASIKKNTDPIGSAAKPPPHLSPSKTAKKRPSTSDIEPHSLRATRDPDMHSSKKQRLSPEKEHRKPTPSTKSLPALLSPTLPPSPGPDQGRSAKLPRLLSPTLPPDLEKELAKLGNISPLSPKRDTPAVKPKRDDPLPSRASNSSNSGSNLGLQNSRTSTSSKDTKSPKLIVKLRYGKANRKLVRGLLKFSDRRKANRTDSPPDYDTDLDDAPVERRGDSGSTERKALLDRTKSKSRQDPGEPPSSSTAPRSKDSKTPAEKSLPTTSHERSKGTSLTPVKDSKSSLPRRNDLADGGGKTPVIPTNKRHSVDPGIKGSPSQPNNRSRMDERRVWREEFQKFGSLGRELKHAADRANNGATVPDEKLAVVTAIEAILCFILAFVADDQSKVIARQVGDSSTWRSILAYWLVVRKNSMPYPALHSLCQILGAVSYDAIHALDLERLAASPIPGEHTPVPTPGSDGNTVLSDENKKSRKEFLELKNRLPECYKESHKLWLDGSRGLAEDVLSCDFPITWSRRSRHYKERGKATLKPGEYAGDFFLPLGGVTPPIEVVRFGCALLKEWCAQEGVEWNGRIGL
ncbi:hypothetical protein N7462_002743 [Penicillium macrosclerotiorum]|uniref:uncharacterized protein n=1 Tax=Penicillium macrosclerotiorum TaxID=303699 RepID=UPI002548D5A6|nr:uncharacterized protein N7462_002743 [Penicillium macrosclerotiorum]KAJ5693320.1 hypothetical protein N7462_002743 [Penicillium macrosclerotiorum]